MKRCAWAVYIIECENGSLYTGITTDLKRRFSEHQSQKKQAKFFRTTKANKIVLVEYFNDRSSASKRELEIKKMSKTSKLNLINS